MKGGRGQVAADQRPGKIRVAIIDDHEVVRIGLRNMLERQPDMVVTVDAATAQEAIGSVPGQADVAVLDIRLPDLNGIEVCRRLKAADPELNVIILTSYGGDDVLFDALMAGAAGYLLKESRGRAVVDAVRTVAEGGSLFDATVTAQILNRIRHSRPADDPLGSLTEQERKILQYIAEGKTNKEIGELVFLSDKTVKHYVSNILSKLGMSRRSEAAAYLARHEHERSDADPRR